MNNRRLLGWLTLLLTVGIALAVWMGLRQVRRAGLMKDIQAGLAARSIQDPDQRLRKYLEGRYGDLDLAATRQRIFVDFFNPERIRALQVLVQRAPEKQRQANTDAMARWIAGYRESLSPEEREELRRQFETDEGRAMLRRARAQYNAQDVRYRGATAGVISELLHTLNDLHPTP